MSLTKAEIKTVNAIVKDLVVCPICKKKTLKITEKKKFRFCFNCEEENLAR